MEEKEWRTNREDNVGKSRRDYAKERTRGKRQ
jgi:hypothetical protein